MEKIKRAFSEHHKSTIIGLALGESSPADWDGLLKAALDKAKMLSDFVGVIMRAGFVFLFFQFFSHMAKTADSQISKGALEINSWLCLVLYFIMLFRLNDIIIAYFLKDTSYHSRRLYKITLTITSFATTASIGYGINLFAKTFASISSLPH